MKLIYTFIAFIITVGAIAQDGSQVFRAAGSPENPKVQISWNRASAG